MERKPIKKHLDTIEILLKQAKDIEANLPENDGMKETKNELLKFIMKKAKEQIIQIELYY